MIAKTMFLGAILLAMTGVAQGAEFACAAKTVVLYSPGPNWSKLPEHVDEHLEFLKEQMSKKIIDRAGPIVNEEQMPSGGMTVFNVADPAETEKIVIQESFARHGVVSFQIHRWNECVPKGE